MDNDAASRQSTDVMKESLQHKAERIVRETIEEYDLKVSEDQIHIHIVDHLKRSRGWCHYDRITPHGEEREGNYAIRIARQIDNFEGTVIHELTHAELYEIYGKSMKHGSEFHELNTRLGGSSGGSCPGEYNYYMTCPECGWVSGRFNYSKKIHSADTFICKQCNNHCSSYKSGEEPPSEHGVVCEK